MLRRREREGRAPSWPRAYPLPERRLEPSSSGDVKGNRSRNGRRGRTVRRGPAGAVSHVPGPPTRLQIACVKLIFESCEGVAVVRTLDRRAAHLVVLVAPDFEADARAAIRALVEEGACAETGPPAGFDGDWLGPEEGD